MGPLWAAHQPAVGPKVPSSAAPARRRGDGAGLMLGEEDRGAAVALHHNFGSDRPAGL
jgi:hypothetical protein